MIPFKNTEVIVMGRRLKITRKNPLSKHHVPESIDESIMAEQQRLEYMELSLELVVTPRTHQQVAFLESLDDPQVNGLVVMPTGTGKTVVMAMHVQHFMKNEQAWLRQLPLSTLALPRKILIIAPTKPLVEQLHERLTRDYFSDLPEDRVVIMTGNTTPEKRALLYQHAWIIIATPQTMQNDVRLGAVKWEEIGLCLVDEIHHARKNHAMAWIIRQYQLHRAQLDQNEEIADDNPKLSRNEKLPPRIIGFSATPGNDHEQVAELVSLLQLNGKLNVSVIMLGDSMLLPHAPDITKHVISLSLPPEYHEALRLVGEMASQSLKKIRAVLGVSYPEDFSELMKLFTQVLKKQGNKTPAEYQFINAMGDYLRCRFLRIMIESQGFPPLLAVLRSWNDKAKGSRGLARFLSQPFMKQLQQLASEHPLPHPKVERLLAIIKQLLEEDSSRKIIVFVSYRATVHYLSDIFNKHELDHASLLGKARDPPILSRHLPTKGHLSTYTLEEFKETGLVNVLLTTSVGEEGLDIGTCDVVIHYDIPDSPLRVIQRRGRARRKAALMYYLIAKETRDERRYHALMNREKQLHQHLLKLQQSRQLFLHQRGAFTPSHESRPWHRMDSEDKSSNASRESHLGSERVELSVDPVSVLERLDDLEHVIYAPPECLETRYPRLLKAMGCHVKVITSSNDQEAVRPLLELAGGHGLWIYPNDLVILLITPMRLLDIARNGMEKWFKQLSRRAEMVSGTWMLVERWLQSSLVVSPHLLMSFYVHVMHHGYSLVVVHNETEVEAFFRELLRQSRGPSEGFYHLGDDYHAMQDVHVRMLACIPGISMRKARVILAHVPFHCLSEITLEELMKIPGIGRRLAQRVMNIFSESS